MSSNDLKTRAIVLRRTNFGETDRIVTLLTPEGKKSALARGVRKEKSKLAGGIEMFSLSDVNLHTKSGASTDDLAILTSARTREFYQNIISSLDRLELGSEVLKQVARAADSFDDPALFDLAVECLSALNAPETYLPLVDVYFRLRLATICGEEINLITDAAGDKLQPDTLYHWDGFSMALSPSASGNITAAHIKLLRLILASNLATLSRVQNLPALLPDLLYIAKSLGHA